MSEQHETSEVKYKNFSVKDGSGFFSVPMSRCPKCGGYFSPGHTPKHEDFHELIDTMAFKLAKLLKEE